MFKKMLFLLIFVASVSLYADELIDHITVGPMMSLYTPKSGDRYFDMIGAVGRIRFNHWGGELALNYRNETVDNDKVWIKAWPISAAALYFPCKHLYVLAGGGFYPLYIDYNQGIDYLESYENEYKMSAGLQAGVGVDFAITELTSVAFDVRGVLLDYRLQKFAGSNDISANSIIASAIVHFKFTK